MYVAICFYAQHFDSLFNARAVAELPTTSFQQQWQQQRQQQLYFIFQLIRQNGSELCHLRAIAISNDIVVVKVDVAVAVAVSVSVAINVAVNNEWDL